MKRLICCLLVAALLGCSATQVATATSDITALANAAEAILAGLPAGSVAPETATQVSTYVAGIQAAQAALNGAQSGTGTAANQLITDGEALLPIVASAVASNSKISNNVTLALSALNVLLPVVAGELGIVAPTTSAAPSVVQTIPPMDIATARTMYGPKH